MANMMFEWKATGIVGQYSFILIPKPYIILYIYFQFYICSFKVSVVLRALGAAVSLCCCGTWTAAAPLSAAVAAVVAAAAAAGWRIWRLLYLLLIYLWLI